MLYPDYCDSSTKALHVCRQRVRTRELEATLERMQGELSAQGLALETMAADREADRMAASKTADRIKV